ncbi:MAG: hypothetical protein ACXVLQ_17125 [Bacteriovorax sp.]
MKTSFLLMSSYFLISVARADIFFVDFNFSTKEIQAAREAAAIRGENVVVIPELSDELRSQLRALSDKVLPLREKMKDPIKNLTAIDAELKTGSLTESKRASLQQKKQDFENKLAVLKAQMGTSETEYETLRAKNVNYNHFSEDMNKALAEMKSNNRTISSMVISGHKTDSYFGESGELKMSDVTGLIKKYPKVTNPLKFVYLWDCYSATYDEVQSWRKFLPQINIFGFYDRSPSQKNTYDMQYLKEAMLKEKTLLSKKDIASIDQILRSIPGIGGPSSLAGAASICNTYFTTQSGTHLLDDQSTICNGARIAELKRRQDVYHQFLLASAKGFEDIQSDTSEGPVRSFYSLAKQMKGCPLVKDITDLTSQAVNLVFFKNLQTNFAIKYEKDLTELRAILGHGDQPIELPNLKSTTVRRHDLLVFAKTLHDRAGKLKTNDPNYPLIQSMSNKMDTLLVNLKCVPTKWIEPTTDLSLLETPDKSCLQ